MTSKSQKAILNELLLKTQGKGRLGAALVVLFTGTTLLLLSLLAWWNFSQLLNSDKPGAQNTSTFIVIGKEITEQNMGKGVVNTFSEQEFEALRHAPEVKDAGAITPALFPIYAMVGGNLSMATDLPLESVPDRFLEEVPADWSWHPGNPHLPVILSSQFLDIYNYVFAPGQGLPQLSRTSVKSIALKLKVGGERGKSYTAHVSGFSDVIGSVLAPQSFIDYGNKHYGSPGQSGRPSQVILKVKDPSATAFINFLDQNHYTANAQNLRWNKIRTIVEAVTGATGLLALLLIGISAIVFMLFIELTITRAQHSLTLLRQLGYSSRHLQQFMARRFLPVALTTMFCSLIICIVVQFIVAGQAAKTGLVLSRLPGWPVWVVFLGSTAFIMLMVVRSVKRGMNS